VSGGHGGSRYPREECAAIDSSFIFGHLSHFILGACGS
jgi:hypothetical protein